MNDSLYLFREAGVKFFSQLLGNFQVSHPSEFPEGIWELLVLFPLKESKITLHNFSHNMTFV